MLMVYEIPESGNRLLDTTLSPGTDSMNVIPSECPNNLMRCVQVIQ